MACSKVDTTPLFLLSPQKEKEKLVQAALGEEGKLRCILHSLYVNTLHLLLQPSLGTASSGGRHGNSHFALKKTASLRSRPNAHGGVQDSCLFLVSHPQPSVPRGSDLGMVGEGVKALPSVALDTRTWDLVCHSPSLLSGQRPPWAFMESRVWCWAGKRTQFYGKRKLVFSKKSRVLTNFDQLAGLRVESVDQTQRPSIL